ncbi:MAG: nucleotidyltransferase domain-containing protein [Planctomycetota bacterium]|nr:nucleotidyltransferase domain-containing protein [Planctomycetota bacterium]
MVLNLPTGEERRRLLDEEVRRYLPILVDLGAEKVILIGSLASGCVHGMSDLDLIVVLETEERFLDRLERVQDALDPRIGLDLLVYSPREFQELQAASSFLEHALSTGKVLYDGGLSRGITKVAGTGAPGS